MAEFYTKLSLMMLKKSSTCSSKFLNNFFTVRKLLHWTIDVIQNAVQYPICWPLGRIAKKRSQNGNSCKMRAYFWLWLVLSLADVIKSLEFQRSLYVVSKQSKKLLETSNNFLLKLLDYFDNFLRIILITF